VETTNSSDKETLLTAMEARVLGALMEKQLTTPENYPLTLNALVTACNQKTSREPVTQYSEGDIHRCVEQLRQRDLIEVEYGSRANRYDQRLSRQLYLEKPAQAILTVLLLRGPQTVNELFSRTARMTRFANDEEVQELLDLLCAKTTPIIKQLPRQSGQREVRYTHLLCGEPSAQVESAPAATRAASPTQPTANNSDLEQRVAELERKVAALMEQVGVDKPD